MVLDCESALQRLEDYATRRGLAELRIARDEFHALTGEFSEGESWFETRMTMFLDWFLLDRVDSSGATINERYLAAHSAQLRREELAQHRWLNVTLRSAFRIAKLGGNRLLLRDIIGGGLWSARRTLTTLGLLKTDIIDLRLVRDPQGIVAGRGAVLHPREAHEAIEKIVSRAAMARMPRQKITDHLDKMKLKLDRYANVKIRHVYQYPDDAFM